MAINLCLAVIAGVAISGWVLFYTDLFPQVATLLSLGGLFAWIAFVSQVVTDKTKEQLQEGVEARVLSRWYFGVGVALVLLAFGLWASRRGSLAVSSFHDTRDRTIEVLAKDNKGCWSRVMVEENPLIVRAEQQWSLPTPLRGFTTYRVKVSGLPACEFPVTARGHKRLTVPYSFSFAQHPALLLHAVAAVVSTAESSPATLVVRDSHGKELGKLPQYRGESVWVGCDEYVDIPEEVLAGWRIELAGAPPERLVRWLMRKSVRADLAISPALSPLTVEVTWPPATPLAPIVVSAPISPPYPQEVKLDFPHL